MRDNRAYSAVFVFALLAAFLPAKAIAYAMPAVALVAFLVFTRSKIVAATLVGLVMFITVGLVLLLFYREQPVIHSYLIWWITHSWIIAAVCLPFQIRQEDRHFAKMLKFASAMIVVQAIIGISQAFIGAAQTGSFDLDNGDRVEGTIHLAAAAGRDFSNPVFSVNVAVLLLCLLPWILHKKKFLLAGGLGAIAVVLSSVMHLILLAATCLILAAILYRPRLAGRGWWLVLTATFIAPFAIQLFLADNLSTLPKFGQGLIAGEYPRATAVKRAFGDMPKEYPLMPLIGIGPGQFSSKAALIGTGRYFGGPLSPDPLPFIDPAIPEATDRYLMDLWMSSAAVNYYGSTHQPFFSILSMYTETGIVGIGALTVYVLWATLWMRRRAINREQTIVAFSCSAALWLLFALGVQEHYWETPQAMFAGALLLKAVAARLRMGRSAARDSSGFGRDAVLAYTGSNSPMKGHRTQGRDSSLALGGGI